MAAGLCSVGLMAGCQKENVPVTTEATSTEETCVTTAESTGDGKIRLVEVLEETESESVTEIETEVVTESETEAESEAETETETETEVETETEATPAPTQTPAPTETETTKETEAPTETPTEPPVPVTVQNIEASVGGNHYIGDSLSAADFNVKVTMSDGSVLTNPGGWGASPLALNSAENRITVTYGGASTTITVPASERPVPTQAPTAVPTQAPAAPEPTQAPTGGSSYDDTSLFDRMYSGTVSLELSKATFEVMNEHLASIGLPAMNWSDDAFIRGAIWCQYHTVDGHEDQLDGGNICGGGGSGFVTPRTALEIWMRSPSHYAALKGSAGSNACAVCVYKTPSGSMLCCMCYGSPSKADAFENVDPFHGPLVQKAMAEGKIPASCQLVWNGEPAVSSNGYPVISGKDGYDYIYRNLVIPYIPGMTDGMTTYSQWRASQGYSYY